MWRRTGRRCRWQRASGWPPAMPPVAQMAKEYEVNGGTDRSAEIVIEGLEVFAHHGLLPGEKQSGQVFRFDLQLTLADCPAVD
ncbi:MAG TPA: hypothetical protein ENH44_00905, partial [Actinobacteria bacterium]|nr:hypothetical protein [Actinomycetota bacterium]